VVSKYIGETKKDLDCGFVPPGYEHACR